MDLDEATLPEGWKPEVGSTVIGKVVSKTRGYSEYQEMYYPIIVIHDEATDRDVSVHAFHMTLQQKLITLQPKVGERIGIKMGEKVPLKNNPKQSVQLYTVQIDGRSEDDDWAGIGSPQRGRARAQPSQPPSELPQTDDDIPF